MQGVLKDPALGDQLIPKWAVGCRRITPGVGYLESLTNEKTTVIYGGIARISPEGCVTEEGEEHAVDVLVCAVRHLYLRKIHTGKKFLTDSIDWI
jgi:hypothetical protein